MKIVFASNNNGKLSELQSLFDNSKFEIIPQKKFSIQSIEETGKTFVENALLKARNASLRTNLPAIADDSGLVVDALDGAPGIYSARFAGQQATQDQHINKLLTRMKNIPAGKRNAYFYCCLVFFSSAEDPTPIITQGIWHGTILTKPQGDNGFGYDPIFFIEKSNKSAAQLSSDEKNRISHRAQAMKSLYKKLIDS